MTQHTPGPWDIGYAQADDIVIVGPDKELEICTVWSDPNVCDAKLIAAAPELLEALKEATLHIWLGNEAGVNANIKAHAIIAKATGETA